MATKKKTQADKKAATKKNPVAPSDNVEELTPQADGPIRQGAGQSGE